MLDQRFETMPVHHRFTFYSPSRQLPVLSPKKHIAVAALGYVAITEWVELLGQAVHLCETAGCREESHLP